MGDVVNLDSYRKKATDTIREADRRMLRTEFSNAAGLLRNPDFLDLSKKSHLFREHFIFHHARALVTHAQHKYPSQDLFPVELQAEGLLKKMVDDICVEVRDGVSLPVARKVWNRAVDNMIEQLVNETMPIVSGNTNRSGVPDPRNG